MKLITKPGTWLHTLRALLPPGRVFRAEDGTVLASLLAAIGASFDKAQQRLQDLLEQSDPAKARTMLEDWERLLGLPDHCRPNDDMGMAERANIAAARLVEQGGQSRQYFIDLAADYGEPGATITEFRPANCNDHCNSPLWAQSARFTWQVTFPRSVISGRMAHCNDHCNSPLQRWERSAAECPITERKPAHTEVVFAYTGAPIIGYDYAIGVSQFVE